MVTEFGMSDLIGNLSFGGKQGMSFEQKPYSKMMARLIDQVNVCLLSNCKIMPSKFWKNQNAFLIRFA